MLSLLSGLGVRKIEEAEAGNIEIISISLFLFSYSPSLDTLFLLPLSFFLSSPLFSPPFFSLLLRILLYQWNWKNAFLDTFSRKKNDCYSSS